MTKEELIKEAYGEYWEIAKQFADENGWIDRFKQSYYLNIGNWGLADPPIIKNILGFNDSAGIHICNDNWRPSILRGIENNNGWTKIESEDDLPKENYALYHVITKTDIFCAEPKNQNVEEYWGNDVNKSAWWMDNVSHYQPIEKPKPPIF